jgi:hypothetical protein
MDEDLYTITQALGKYYNNNLDSRYVSPLHPLLYTSKSNYEASQDRYAKEECKLDISKQEFYNFVKRGNLRKFAVFVKGFMPVGISLSFQAFVVTQKEFLYLVKKKHLVTYYKPNLLIEQIMTFPPEVKIPMNYNWQDVSGIPLKISDMFLSLFATGAAEDPDNKYDISGFTISFDVVTIYQILTDRGSCVSIIKNYAKKLTLEIFDNYIKLLNEPGSIYALNLYLQTNALILGIDESLYFTLLTELDYSSYSMSETVLQNYITDTLEQRLNLINIIRETILSLDKITEL